MRRAVPILVIVFVAVALLFWLKGNTGSPPVANVPIKDRIPKLKKQVADQEAESELAVINYVPKVNFRIDDLGSPAVDLLRNLPGVVQVEAGVTSRKPNSRIVHLRDWHFVPKDLYAIDMKQVHGRELTPEEIDRLHQELLLEVELVQFEQMALLRSLIKYHGLKVVYAEGFSPCEHAAYRERIAVLRSMEQKQIPTIRTQLDEVRKLADGATAETKSKAEEIEGQLSALLTDHKARLLEFGAAGRLLISGELEDVLPLEGDGEMEKAKPITADGKVQPDTAKIEARHDAQVKMVAREGTVAVIVLGGSHDLSKSVQRIGGENCEYLRVTTKRVKEFAD
jgi:hypothetical protein